LEVRIMTLARVFKSGNSQAVRLPKEFRLDADQIEIFRDGQDLVLRQLPLNGAAVFDLLSSLPADFKADGRQDTPSQESDRPRRA
jgi:antitoxin VapB